MSELMRLLDQVTRLGSDTISRVPRGSPMWSWPVAAAVAGSLLILVGTSASQVATESSSESGTVGARAAVADRTTDAAVSPATASPAHCQAQTWPYLSDDCLQREKRAFGHQEKAVRVIRHDPALATAAIGTTEWTRRAKSWPKEQQPGRKQKDRKQNNNDPERTVTVRSGRRDRDGASQRVYVVPSDSAYHAYGSAAR